MCRSPSDRKEEIKSLTYRDYKQSRPFSPESALAVEIGLKKVVVKNYYKGADQLLHNQGKGLW